MEALREVYRQLVQGLDFDGPDTLLRNVSAEQAVAKLPGWPYSIGTNVAHADHWQKIWLARLTGARAPKTFPDFPEVEPAEWEHVRRSFLLNLAQAQEIASAETFSHKMRDDATARKLLLQIALHNAYHLGQIKLLKRLLRASKQS